MPSARIVVSNKVLSLAVSPVFRCVKCRVKPVHSSTSISSSVILTCGSSIADWSIRSEEHTSELQSQSNIVCRLLLEKKKFRRKPCGLLRANLQRLTLLEQNADRPSYTEDARSGCLRRRNPPEAASPSPASRGAELPS